MIKIILISVSLLGLYLFLKGLVRLRRRQSLRGGVQTSTGAVFLALTAIVWAVSSHLYTYQRLSHEQAVAELEFIALGPQNYQAKLYFPDGKRMQWELKGDEWQLGARILKWHSTANLFGMDTVYRLDRLSGHFRDIEREREDKHTVYALSANPGLDIWNMAQRYTWFPWVDAVYGSAAYMPMADQSRYKVSLSQSGMVIRPVNAQAKNAVTRWR